MTDDHQPPQPQAQGDPQARRPARRATSWARSSPRARTCSPPPTRPAGAASHRSWPPAAGSPGARSSRTLLADVSALGSGTRALGVYEQRWAAPAGPLCVALWGVGDPGNVGTVLRAALAFGAGCVALGPGSADPVRAEGGAGVDGRDLRRAASRACARSPSCPARRSRSSRARASRCTGRVDGDATLVVGAERDGLPDDVVAACDARRPHPDRPRSR